MEHIRLVLQYVAYHEDYFRSVMENHLKLESEEGMPDGRTLKLEMADTPFAFSTTPYAPQQLEQTAHREELPRPVRTVVTICGTMRGVGGIDSRGADVEKAYQVSGEKDWIAFFRIRL